MSLLMQSTFGFIYTFRCTAECEHCCFQCSPAREEKLDFDIAKNVILYALSKPQFRTVFFSGGEIFLYFNELIELMKLVKKRLSIICATNGFWGKDMARAGMIVRQLKNAGLSRLIVSYDEYHARYVQPQSVINILRLCKRNMIPVEVQSMASRKSWRLSSTVDMLLRDITEISVSEAAILPVGAASQRFTRDELLFEYEDCPDRCLGSDALTIFPNGDVYSCCSPVSLFIPVLRQGTLNKVNTDIEMDRILECNTIMYYLRKYGISGTCKRLWYDHVKGLQQEGKYVNPCDKCYQLLRHIPCHIGRVVLKDI